MNIAILGFGKEGKSVLKFLKTSEYFSKARIAILDQKFDENYLKNLQNFDIVFRSPGVPYNLPEIQSAIKKGAVFSSATKLFFDLCPANIIGVTGTKGKSTTSTLIFKILKRAGFDAHLAGNIGKPALDILPQIQRQSAASPRKSATFVVLELSSFQLQDLGKSLPPTRVGVLPLGKGEKSPRVAVVVDTFPDHLDTHKSVKEYLDAKANIAKHQKDSDAIFYFKDNSWSSKIANKSGGKKIAIAGENFGVKKNLVMASSVAAYLGCPPVKIHQTLKNFRGLEHRLELARQIGQIKFYNDSASTNPHTAAAAIASFASQSKASPLILIGGGKDKNLDYQPLEKAIRTSGNVKLVALFGENKYKIKKQISGAGCSVKLCADLKSAVECAYQKAKTLNAMPTGRQAKPRALNPIILFSPGAASFDMFKDYKARGKKFKSLVFQLK